MAIDPALILRAVGTGLLFGASAGLAPGPLLALVVAESVRGGTGRGIRVAAAPLLTDTPIVIGSVLLVGALAGGTGLLLGAVALAGSLFVLHLARETWTTAGIPEPGASGSANPWLRGMAVNLLSPHPYLFWLTVGAPTVVAVAAGGAAPVAAFLIAFGVASFVHVAFLSYVVAGLAIAAGALMLMNKSN